MSGGEQITTSSIAGMNRDVVALQNTGRMQQAAGRGGVGAGRAAPVAGVRGARSRRGEAEPATDAGKAHFDRSLQGRAMRKELDDLPPEVREFARQNLDGSVQQLAAMSTYHRAEAIVRARNERGGRVSAGGGLSALKWGDNMSARGDLSA